MHRDAPLFVLTSSFFGRVVERSEKPECIYVGGCVKIPTVSVIFRTKSSTTRLNEVKNL